MLKVPLTWSLLARIGILICLYGLTPIPIARAVYEEFEYEIASFPVSTGIASFQVRAWKQTEDGGGPGIRPANPVPESAFVRMYNNGRLVDNRSIAFLNAPGQEIESVTVSGTVAGGTVSVRFINGYRQLNPGGLPALPQRTFIIYALDDGFAPSITPTPTPTPRIFDANNLPRVQWMLPRGFPRNVDGSITATALSPVTVKALGDDQDQLPAEYRLSHVILDGPTTQPSPLTFPMARREVRALPGSINPQVAEVTFEVYSEAEGVRYPGFRYPGVYTFTAQAFDGLGASREITLTVTVTDSPPPSQNIQAMIVSGAGNPDEVFAAGANGAEANLRGGIFTLGTVPLAGNGRGPLSFEPDNELLTGQKLPPFVPWVYDVRELTYRIQARTAGGGVVPLRDARGLEAQRMLVAPNQTPFTSRPPISSAAKPVHPTADLPPPRPVPTPSPAR